MHTELSSTPGNTDTKIEEWNTQESVQEKNFQLNNILKFNPTEDKVIACLDNLLEKILQDLDNALEWKKDWFQVWAKFYAGILLLWIFKEQDYIEYIKDKKWQNTQAKLESFQERSSRLLTNFDSQKIDYKNIILNFNQFIDNFLQFIILNNICELCDDNNK